jgi:flagellar biosynthesis/type III secretory pathway chaperone
VTDPFTTLADVLRQEASRYRELGKLAKEQKEILVTGRMEDLPVNVKKQEKEMFALGPLSDERRKALEAAALSLRITKPTLKEVAERCPAEQAEGLRESLKEVVEAARTLDMSNKGNTKLLENAVSYVNFTLEALQGKGMAKIPNYQPETGTGMVPPAPPSTPTGGTQWTA